jgi:hypothetical protein
LPGVGKPFDQFQVDDMLCRQYAQAQTSVPPGEAGTRDPGHHLGGPAALPRRHG